MKQHAGGKVLSVALIVSMLTACTQVAGVPIEQQAGQVTAHERKHRIRLVDGTEYMVKAFTVSDSVVVVQRLDSSDVRYASVMPPITLPRSEVMTVEKFEKSPSAIGVLLIAGCAAGVFYVSVWLFTRLLASAD
jgi:hypothetical protein